LSSRNPNVLNILHISQNYYIRGGSDRMFFAISRLLKEHGHDVIPFCAASQKNRPSEYSNYFPAAADFDHPGIVDYYRYLYSRPAKQTISKLIAEKNIDIAHLHIYYGKLTSSILTPIVSAGIPIVQTVHDYKLVCPVYTFVSHGKVCEACKQQQFWRALPRRCNRNSLSRTALSVVERYVSKLLGSIRNIDRFIPVSHFVHNKLIEHGIPANKITTLHNFIEFENDSVNNRPGEYFLYFGRIETIKGIFTLLEAAKHLPKIPVLIAGDGNDKNAFLAYIESNKITNIQYVGFKNKNEIRDLIKGSICTITPSKWYEPLALTVLESFVEAKPVIASNIGGISEVISDGVDGLLIEAGNSKDLELKMKWIVEHRDFARTMGKKGQRKVLQNFNSDQYYEKLMEIYHSVLSNHPIRDS